MVYGVDQVSSGSLYGQGGNKTQQLDKDAFLHLLVTELRFQDPLDPLKDRDFIAQMAQFSSLEQMQNLYHVGEMQQATALIGRSVLAEQYVNGIPEQIYGRVTGVKTVDGETFILLDSGREIKPNQVVSVLDEAGLKQHLEEIVGHKAFVRVYNEAGEVVDLKEILITGYKLENGTPYVLTQEGEEETAIPLSELWGVV